MKEVNFIELHSPVARTTTGNGTGADTQGFIQAGKSREMRALLNVGTVSGTTPTLDVKIAESDTQGGTYTDITGATFAQKTAAGNEIISFSARKRWLRITYTIGGTTPSFVFCVNVLGTSRQA